MRPRLILFLLLLIVARVGALVSAAQTTEADETAVGELVRKYYSAYEEFDFDGQKAMWSPNSVDPAAKSKQTKERAQAMMTRPKIDKLDIWRVTVDGDRAEVLAKVLLTTLRKDNGKPVGGWYNREASFRHSLVRENGEWKLSFIEFRVTDLMNRLKEARSDEERDRLVQEYKDLSENDVASAFSNQAFETMRDSDPAVQLSSFKVALRYAEKIDDKETVSMLLSNMASVYTRIGDHGEALLCDLKALELDQQIGEKGNVPNALNSVGYSYSILGDTQRALEYFRRSAEAPQLSPGSVERQLRVSGNLANTYLELGDIAKAREIWTQLAGLVEKNKDKDQAAPLLGFAAIAREEGKFAEAIELYKRGLAADDAMKIKNRGRDSFILRRLGEMSLAMGSDEEAIRYSDLALERLKSLGYVDLKWEPLVYKAKANIKLGRLKAARADLEEAIRVIEAMRERSLGGEETRQQFFRDKLAPYTTMVELMLLENDETSAFEISESAKARILLDLITGGRRRVQKFMTGAERQEEAKLIADAVQAEQARERAAADPRTPPARLTELEAAAKKAKRAHEEFRTRLYIEHPDIKVNRGEMKTASFSDAAMLADRSTAILEYVVSEGKSFLFAITIDTAGRPSIKSYPLSASSKEMSRKVSDYRSTVASGGLDFAKQSRELYDLVVKPAASQLAGKTGIIIVPDGPLWDLPFQTLQNATGKYLIEFASLSYAPSLSGLREMERRSRGRTPAANLELLAFGNPFVQEERIERMQKVFMSEKLDPLPEAERLVSGLAKMYGPNRSRIFTGAAAREQIAKEEAPKFRIVQFATHGILNNASPMYSHLVLARDENDPKEDGLLEAWEMKDLDLKADMVILSACDTARGKISGGEGVVGMTWAMFIAGAPTTVASQWKVESSSTTEFMLEFHRQMLGKQKISKAEALRRASLKLMKMPQYRHPSYWGAWVMVGDGS